MYLIQTLPTESTGLPSWLTSGPLPVILLIIAALVIRGFWVDYRMKKVQKHLGELGQEYYHKEQVLLDELKAGRITRSEYRTRHDRLVNEMRVDSRKFTDV